MATHNISDVTQQEVVRLMVNRDVTYEAVDLSDLANAEVLLELRDFSGERFDDISLKVHSGEVVGLPAWLVLAVLSCWNPSSIPPSQCREGLLRGSEVNIRTPEDA